MTDRDQNIIALAEWMGLRCEGCTYIENKYGIKEFVPDCCCDIHGFSPYGFNPYESADDCEAVVRKLKVVGFAPIVDFTDDYETVSCPTSDEWPAPIYMGDDWKEGVCELALKVAVEAEQ